MSRNLFSDSERIAALFVPTISADSLLIVRQLICSAVLRGDALLGMSCLASLHVSMHSQQLEFACSCFRKLLAVDSGHGQVLVSDPVPSR